MYFENKEIDPRDCQYRANSKIRKQIEKLIRANKIKYGLIGKQTLEDATLRKNTSAVKNRFKSAKKDSEGASEDKENDEDAVLRRAGFSKDRMITFLEQLDSILLHEEEQKQAFSYEDLVKMHQLLQYLEEDLDEEPEAAADGRGRARKDAAPSFRSQYFFQFMEGNFRVIQPEKRKNAALDERLRKLRYQAASKEYDTMTATVSRAFRGSVGGSPGSAKSGGFTMSQELRNIRSTLIATGNALMVIVATFAFFYIAFGYARPDYSTASRVLFSFSASMVVAVAEVYFLIRII